MYYDRKTLKKIQKKRKAKTRKVWGIVLMAIGVIGSIGTLSDFDVATFLTGIAMTAGGTLLFFTAQRDVAKWDRYFSMINTTGNTSIKALSGKMGIPEQKVMRDLQHMIGNGFFLFNDGRMNAYINKQYNVLVMTVDNMDLEPITEKFIKESEQTVKVEAKEEPSKAAVTVSDHICEAIRETDDLEMVECLCGIDDSLKNIEEFLKKNPEFASRDDIKKLYSRYIPQTIEIMEKYTSGKAGEETMRKIREMLFTCNRVFKGIEKKLGEFDDADTLVDIEVMKQNFERDGVLGSDFDIKSDFTVKH